MAEDEDTTEVTEQPAGRIALDDAIDASLPATREPGELEEPAETPETETPRETHLRETPEEPPEEAETEPAPADKTVKYKGKEISLQDLIDSGQLSNLLITADKYTELQKKHEELLEEKKAPPTESPTPPSQQELRAIYDPEVAETVKKGYLSQDFVDSWPDEATQFVMHRDLLYEARQRVEKLENLLNTLVQQGTTQSWQTYLTQMLDTLAKRKDDDLPEGFFGTLNEPEMRGAFLDYLKTLQPRQDQLTGDGAEDFLMRQFVAFNRDAWAEAMRVQRETGDKKRSNLKDQKRRATGDSPGPRGATPETPANDGPRIALDDEIDAMLPQQ